jgi:hypothetical protein
VLQDIVERFLHDEEQVVPDCGVMALGATGNPPPG